MLYDMTIAMFWLVCAAIGATVIAFYMDEIDRLEADKEWDALIAAVESGRADL